MKKVIVLVLIGIMLMSSFAFAGTNDLEYVDHDGTIALKQYYDQKFALGNDAQPEKSIVDVAKKVVKDSYENIVNSTVPSSTNVAYGTWAVGGAGGILKSEDPTDTQHFAGN